MGSETRLEAPLGKGPLASPGTVCSLLVFTTVASIQVSVGNNLFIYFIINLVYYENSFHICLSLVVGREFKQTKWQTLYFEAGEVAQWLK